MTDHPPSPPDRRYGAGETRAERALAAAGLGEFEWRRGSGRLFISRRLAAILGCSAGTAEAEGEPFARRFVHPEDVEPVCAAIDQGLAAEGRFRTRCRLVRGDGGLLWAQVVGFLAEPPDQVVGVVADISARKAEEDEREALVAELDHRVKNVLTSVQSLAAQSARKTVSLDAFLKTFAGRLDAMAAAHALLTATRWRGADIASIAAAELGGLAPGQARWHGEDIVLNARATNALTLALHELAANAVKFGALSVEHGRVDVTWRALEHGGFELRWQERDGPSVAPPARRGFGSTLLERVTGRELGGETRMEFRADGLTASICGGASAVLEQRAGEPPAAPDRHLERVGASLGMEAPGNISGMKVLLVEDAVLLALELEAGLSEAGAEVVGAATSLDEARQMADLSFDVAVLDANLNGQSVRPFACDLQRLGKPFVFATGYGDRVAAPEGFDAPVVRKPYNVHQIAAALAQAAGRG